MHELCKVELRSMAIAIAEEDSASAGEHHHHRCDDGSEALAQSASQCVSSSTNSGHKCTDTSTSDGALGPRSIKTKTKTKGGGSQLGPLGQRLRAEHREPEQELFDLRPPRAGHSLKSIP